MKRFFLISLTLSFSVFGFSQNILVDDGFEKKNIPVVKSPAEAQPGAWFIMNNTLPDGKAEVRHVILDEEEHNGCIEISTTHEGTGILGWHRFCVGQKIPSGKIEKGIYRLSFDARTKSGRGHVYVFIKKAQEVKGQNPDTKMSYATFFKVADWDMMYDVASTRSASVHKQNITAKWGRYSVEFDMSKVTNLYNAIGSNDKLKITDSDDDILDNCYIAIMDINKRETVYIDNVVLEKIR